MTLEPDVTRTVMLGVLTSIIDGATDEAEQKALVSGVVSAYGVPQTDVELLVQRLTSSYLKEGLNKKPVTVVRRGASAMRRLSGRSRWQALNVCKQVAGASGGVDDGETLFIEELVDVIKSW